MAAPQWKVDQGNSVVEVVCEMCLLSNIVVIILVKKIYIASDLAFRVILNLNFRSTIGGKPAWLLGLSPIVLLKLRL